MTLGASSIQAILLLVLGAVFVLLATRPLSGNPTLASVVALPFVLAAGYVGLSAASGPALAVVALSGIALLASLLVPTLELEDPAHVVEATALLLLATAGGVALANAGDLVQAVVGLETVALSAVTLVALGRGQRPLEAAFKYFVLGAISLSSLLFGVGLVYLATGSFAFPTSAQVASNTMVLVGTALVALGFAFELAVFPFHWGALDAYTAAAPGIAGFVMSASKLAAAYAIGRLALGAGAQIQQLLVWVGVATIVWGTLAALAQGDLRRMLGYSAIVHAGFIVLASGSGPQGPAVAAFYATVYASMAMLVFASLAGRGLERYRFEELGGAELGPVRAGALALGLFSLSGIPPTPGFWAKLAVLVVAWQNDGAIATVLAVIGGVISVLYYLRPIPDLFAHMRAGLAGAAVRRVTSVPGIVLAAAFVVVFGLFPGVAWLLSSTLGRGG